MKTLKDYLYLIPVWIREDESFNKFYTSLISIMIDCQQTKEDIITSFTTDEIPNFDKSLEAISSYFGINRNFYRLVGNKVLTISESGGTWSYTYEPDTVINISITNEVLFRMIKFKLLQSNYDGTLKHLVDNFKELFKDDISIQFLEDKLIVGAHLYPVLNLNLVINENTTLDEATLFINGAYSFNQLGVVTRYSLGGRTIELIWDQSDWDESNWKL